MNIGIIGAGFTGLSAAYFLQKKGHTVTIFEKDARVGGLAIGYQKSHWKWSLEHHYHHWFTNDRAILSLAKEIDYPVHIHRPKTSVYLRDSIVQLDSPVQLLKFPFLSPIEKIRMGGTLAALRYNPFWQPFEKVHAIPFLKKTMGNRGYTMIWEPQLINKFGEYVDEMSLAWFWARIKKRTASLAYPEGGFLHFAEYLAKHIERSGGKILVNHPIESLVDDKNPVITTKAHTTSKQHSFDAVIVTLPTSLFVSMSPTLPDRYKKSLSNFKGLGASNLILRLKKPFFNDHTYWLSVCDKRAPIMAIVEHTNFIDKKYYGNEHIVYLGNYLSSKSTQFAEQKDEVFTRYNPYLQKINPSYAENLIDYELFKAPYAQPIITTNYSKVIPKITTPFAHTFLANMQQVYPWDRGTNYAVELGEKVSHYIR